MGYLERARELLGLLRDPGTRERGEALARDLERRTATGEETELLVQRVFADGAGELRVLTLPSIFAPEDWGRTFLRGLLARPLDSYRGRTVVELGSGSGWVAIALAKATAVKKIFALDLNPQAALVTEINARLNGVAERIEAGVSDLLSALEGVEVDLVCGNIPQVLNPDEVARAERFTDDAPARVLRMLGDYTPLTGNYEDVLSLGLIATALERTLEHLSPDGRIVLNLAGRPGFDVIRWVFARWGYATRVVYKDRIRQDPTTDITPFARAEERTGREFSFYASRDARERLTARDAVERRARGEDVFHDLFVVEGRPYRQLAIDGARRFLDDSPRIPYTEDPGSELEELRDEAAIYLACYLRLAPTPEEIFVAPSREDLMAAVALATKAHVTAALGTRAHPDALGADGVRALLDGARTLVLDVTYAPITSTRREPSELEELLDGLWRREDAILVIDLAEHLRTPEVPLVIALAGAHWRALQRVAEATWSRAPLVPQAALRQLLASLNERYRGPRPFGGGAPIAGARPETPLVRELGLSPAFEPAPHVPRRIRLDFGESEFPVSERLREGLLEGLRTTDGAALVRGATSACAEFLSRTRGGVPVRPDELVLGAGVQPMIGAVIAAARALGGGGRPLVLLPRPFYGLFPAVVLAAGADLATVDSRVEPEGLVLDEDDIRARAKHAAGRPLVLLVANPNNPTGLYIHRLGRLLALAEEIGAIALVDEVFFTLAHSGRGETALGAREGRVVVLEGLAKSFAAGGLRFGVAWSANADLRSVIRPAPPWRGALGAARGQLRDFEADLRAHVEWLRARVGRTLTVLRELELEVVKPAAGLFVSVDMTRLEKRLWTRANVWGEEPASRPEPEDFRANLAHAAGLVISPDHWSGWALPYRRLVFSIADLDEALVRLRAFSTVLED